MATPRAERSVRLALLPLLAGVGLAQSPQPTVRIALAPAALRSRLPALAELCERHLGRLVGELPASAVGIEWRDGTMRQFAADVRLPHDVVVAGSCRVGDGPPLLWSTGCDGTEDWFVPPGFVPPPAWTALLHTVGADALDTPMTIATGNLTAHLAGPTVDGDPRGGLLLGLATTCGDATWIAWRNGPALRVRGRSDGGLWLPAVLALAGSGASPRLPTQALRAFTGRDGHRTEAARQLLRGDATASRPVLRALLHADDDTALAAVDALVRLCAADELPNIIASATPDHPATTLAAVQAMHTLWPKASAATRQHTRGAIARCQCIALRELDLAALAGEPPPHLPAEPSLDGRGRALVWLSLTTFALCGLWLRERHRPGILPA